MAGKDESTSSLKVASKPLPDYLTEHNKVYEEYKTRLGEFRDYCDSLKGKAKDHKGDFQKHYVEAMKKAAESYDVMNGRFNSYPVQVPEYFREKMYEVILEEGLLPIFCDHVIELLPSKPKDKTARNVLDWSMKPIMNSCYYLADACSTVAGHPMYLTTVADFIQKSDLKPDKPWKEILQYALYQILNISRWEENKDLLLKAGFELILSRYAETTVSHNRLAALATLANIVDEDKGAGTMQQDPETDTTGASAQPSKKPASKSDAYKTTPKSVNFLLGKIKDASKDKTGISDGWPLISLLQVVGRLAQNDHNSRLLVQQGCLPYLAKLANSKDLENEMVAVRSLGRLAFVQANALDMVTMDGFNLVLILEQLFQHGKDENLLWYTSIALFTLKESLQKAKRHPELVERIEKLLRGKPVKCPKAAQAVENDERRLVQAVQECEISPGVITVTQKKTPQSDGSVVCKEEGHIQVMLSYNQNHREKVKDISMFLLENGYKVWLDINNMSGDTFQAMAEAVEGSDVICICFSKAYKDSQYCRMEAEYAVRKNKALLPLKMENLELNGWLGIIVEPLLYINFTGAEKYPDKEMKQKLLVEINRKVEEEKKAKSNDEKAVVPRKN